MLNEEARDRILNWKFARAAELLDNANASQAESELIAALARTFGDSGWFEGDVGLLVGVAVETLLVADDVLTLVQYCRTYSDGEVQEAARRLMSTLTATEENDTEPGRGRDRTTTPPS